MTNGICRVSLQQLSDKTDGILCNISHVLSKQAPIIELSSRVSSLFTRNTLEQFE